MHADQRPTDETAYESPTAEDVELVAGTTETVHGAVSQTS